MTIPRARRTGLWLSAALALAAGLVVAGCGGGHTGAGATFQPAAAGDPGADTIALRSVVAGQYLVPVQIGNQVFQLLLDTGFQGALVFGDLIKASNTYVKRTGTTVDLRFGSGTRHGEFATAPLAVGQHAATRVRIVVIDQPTSTTDASLRPRGAQGILGLRFKPGTGTASGGSIDPALLALSPRISSLEFNLTATGTSTLTLGNTPVLNSAAGSYVFRAHTTTALNANRANESYADLEVPFEVASSAGSAATPGLRVLLDTGATSGLVLDTAVASLLGYDPGTKQWSVPATEELDFRLLGTPTPLPLTPRVQVGSVLVANLSGASFDAVVGVAQWQPFVVAFDFIDWTLGGPSGTFRFLRRDQLAAAQSQSLWPTTHYTPLTGLNSSSEDASPAVSGDGSLVVWCSDRPGGQGLRDIYGYRVGQGLVDFGPINSAANDEAPAVSADGNLIAFTSNRPGGQGGWDIYLYNVAQRAFVDLPGLNTPYLERAPALSPDGRYLSFRSERRGSGDTTSELFVYDLQTQQLLDLPGLNGGTNQWVARMSQDARLIAYDAELRPGDQGIDDVHVYDRVNQREIRLSQDVNSAHDELFPALSADGRYLVFQTDRYEKHRSADGMNVVVYDLTQTGSDGGAGVAVDVPGLNVAYFESQSPLVSADGRSIVFSSNRPRGVGGEDIYLYQLGH